MDINSHPLLETARPGQLRLLEQTKMILGGSGSYAYVEAPPGSGKTRFMAILSECGISQTGPIVLVVGKTNLVKQHREAFAEFHDNGWISRDYVITTWQKLRALIQNGAKNDADKALLEQSLNAALLIIDECHDGGSSTNKVRGRIPIQSFHTIINGINPANRIYVSATTSGMNEEYLGPRPGYLARITHIEAYNEGYLNPVLLNRIDTGLEATVRRIEEETGVTFDEIITEETSEGMENKLRELSKGSVTASMVEEIVKTSIRLSVKMYSEGYLDQPALVFCPSKAFAAWGAQYANRYLPRKAMEAGIPAPGTWSANVTTDNTDRINEAIVDEFTGNDGKRILFVCGMLNTGFDYPELAVAFDCHYTANNLRRMVQKIGRIIRKPSDQPKPVSHYYYMVSARNYIGANGRTLRVRDSLLTEGSLYEDIDAIADQMLIAAAADERDWSEAMPLVEVDASMVSIDADDDGLDQTQVRMTSMPFIVTDADGHRILGTMPLNDLFEINKSNRIDWEELGQNVLADAKDGITLIALREKYDTIRIRQIRNGKLGPEYTKQLEKVIKEKNLMTPQEAVMEERQDLDRLICELATGSEFSTYKKKKHEEMRTHIESTTGSILVKCGLTTTGRNNLLAICSRDDSGRPILHKSHDAMKVQYIDGLIKKQKQVLDPSRTSKFGWISVYTNKRSPMYDVEFAARCHLYSPVSENEILRSYMTFNGLMENLSLIVTLKDEANTILRSKYEVPDMWCYSAYLHHFASHAPMVSSCPQDVQSTGQVFTCTEYQLREWESQYLITMEKYPEYIQRSDHNSDKDSIIRYFKEIKNCEEELRLLYPELMGELFDTGIIYLVYTDRFLELMHEEVLDHESVFFDRELMGIVFGYIVETGIVTSYNGGIHIPDVIQTGPIHSFVTETPNVRLLEDPKLSSPARYLIRQINLKMVEIRKQQHDTTERLQQDHVNSKLKIMRPVCKALENFTPVRSESKTQNAAIKTGIEKASGNGITLVSGEIEGEIRDTLNSGIGIRKTATMHDVGVSVVQKIRQDMPDILMVNKPVRVPVEISSEDQGLLDSVNTLAKQHGIPLDVVPRFNAQVRKALRNKLERLEQTQ